MAPVETLRRNSKQSRGYNWRERPRGRERDRGHLVTISLLVILNYMQYQFKDNKIIFKRTDECSYDFLKHSVTCSTRYYYVF